MLRSPMATLRRLSASLLLLAPLVTAYELDLDNKSTHSHSYSMPYLWHREYLLTQLPCRVNSRHIAKYCLQDDDLLPGE